MPDVLDWTITSAPEPGEKPLRDPVRPPRRFPKPSRRIWLLTSLVVAVGLAGLAVYARWSKDQIRQEILRVIAQEELAAQSGDGQTLTRLTDQSDPVWARMQLRLAQGSQAAPVPSQVLRPAPDRAPVITLVSAARDRVRADVSRTFVAPDGSLFEFTLAQFYRFTGRAWKRSAPPAEWNDLAHHSGAYVDITYYAVDAAFVEQDLGPYLDAVFQRACDAWGCPALAGQAGGKFHVRFDNDSFPSLLLGSAPLPADEPLVLAFTRYQDFTAVGDTLLLPAPQRAGYPANPQSAAWYRRALAAQALGDLAARLVRLPGTGPSRNAFAYALAARMAASLGVESPAAASLLAPGPAPEGVAASLSSSVNLMWDMGQRDHHGQLVLSQREPGGILLTTDEPAARDQVLRGALAAVNWLLRGQGLEADVQLFNALATAHDQTDWLALGFGIPTDEAWARLQLAVWNAHRVAGQQNFLLNCSFGVGLTTQGQSQPVYFLFNNQNALSSFQSFSPDGRRLALDYQGQPLVVDLESGAFTRLPAMDSTEALDFRGWLADSVAAYTVVTPSNGPEMSGAPLFMLHYFDAAEPERALTSTVGIQDYRLSPDKTRAAVIFDVRPRSPQHFQLAVMPPQGGPWLIIDDDARPDQRNSFPVWSPDSRQLAYTHLDPASRGLSLRVADAATGLSREILGSRVLGAGPDLSALLAWSPNGGQIAFVLHSGGRGDTNGRLGLVNADGANLKFLRTQPTLYIQLGFSADGSVLASLYYDALSDSAFAGKVGLYDPATAGQIGQVQGYTAFAWAPNGRQLALTGDGLYLLADAARPAGQPAKLASGNCYDLAWRSEP